PSAPSQLTSGAKPIAPIQSVGQASRSFPRGVRVVGQESKESLVTGLLSRARPFRAEQVRDGNMMDAASLLEQALDELIGSGPFDRLLASAERPVEARAEAGHDYVVAAVARALDAPVLAVAAAPYEAESLARGIEAFLGPDRVALLPAWEALPY